MIVYKKLENILKERGLKWKDLCKSGIGTNTPQSFSKNKNLNTSNIDKVCAFLGVQPGDIMEWVESENELKIKELQRQKQELESEMRKKQEELERQIAQLEESKK